MADVIITGQVSGFDKIQSSLANTATSLNLLQEEAKENEKVWGEFNKQLNRAGIAMEGAGAAIAATLAIATKAAAEEQDGIVQLAVSLGNVGVSYDSTRDRIESYVSQLEETTGFQDGEFRSSLSRLVTMTQDYDISLKSMSVTADIARAMNMDLASATQIVGMALNGHTRGLKQLGINLKEGASQTQILDELTRRFGGTAQEMATKGTGPFTRLKNAIDNLKESFGAGLLPIIQKIAGGLAGLIERMNQLPRWAFAAVEAVAALAAVLLSAGGAVALFVANKAAITATFMALKGGIAAVLGVALPAIGTIALWTAAIVLAAAVGFEFGRRLENLSQIMIGFVTGPIVNFGRLMIEVFTQGPKKAFENFFGRMNESIKFGKEGINDLKTGFTSDMDAVGGAFKKAGGKVKGFFDEIKTGVKENGGSDGIAALIKAMNKEFDRMEFSGKWKDINELLSDGRDELAGVRDEFGNIPAEELQRQIEGIGQAVDNINFAGLADELHDGVDAMEEFRDSSGNIDNIKVAFDEFYESIKLNGHETMELAKATFAEFSQGIGDSVGQAIMFGDDLGKSMMNVLKNVAASIISFLVQMGIRWILTHVIMKAIGSAFHLSQIMGNMGVTYSNAYASTAAIPIVGPVIAPEVAAASVQAMLAGSLAFGGAAAGGLDEVPNTGTFLVHRGERIVSPQQNRDLTAFLAGRGQGGSATTVVQAPLILQGMAIVDDYSLDQASEMLADRVQKRLSLRMR